MRTLRYFGMLAWMCVAVWTQELDTFVEEEDEAALESAMADRRDLGKLALRWRLRGAALEIDKLQIYQRVEWQLEEGREIFLLTERDPGEVRWVDFAAFYLKWKREGLPVDLVLGDLRPGWGTGLVFGRSSGRGGLLLPHPGADSGRIEYRSSGENHALRGVALRYRRGRVSGMAIGGQAWRDARIDEEGRVTSLPESGYHVTATEEAGRHLLRLRVIGGRLRYQAENWKAGGSLQLIGFTRPVDLRRAERKPWAFWGQRQRLWAVDGEGLFGDVEVRGEVGCDDQGHWGMIAGARVDLKRARLRGLVRRYDPGFHSFFGGAPSRGGMQNERGFLLLLEGGQRRGRWRVFADWYRRPQRTYYYPLPAVISAWGVSLERRLRKHLKGRMLYQEDLRPRWREGQSLQERSRRLRAELEFGRGKGMLDRLRLRLEGRVLNDGRGGERGGLAALLWKGRWRPVRLVFHLTRFLTDSYYTRIYEYEYDLPGAVSIRPLYGEGWRSYALVGVKWGAWEFSGRYRYQRDVKVRHYGGVQVDMRLGG